MPARTNGHAGLAGARTATGRTPSHKVEFYDSDDYLAASVSEFLADGLRAGEGAVVVATGAHRTAIEEALAGAGIDVGAARDGGQYVAHDASELLSRFMVDDVPNGDRFHAVVGDIIATVGAGRPGMRVFGEMVALLCEDGHDRAALELERLWNELARSRSFMLFCAYPMSLFDRAGKAAGFESICDEHSVVVPSESYAALAAPDRRREVAVLQQQARAAHAERDALSLEHALQINDDIMQGLVVAQMALDLDDIDRARDAIRRTLDRASALVNERLAQVEGLTHLSPGFGRRDTAARG
jgi:hypothetical protein